jgi:tripartite-type tricarboxylate transporter receptor subunit TctC
MSKLLPAALVWLTLLESGAQAEWPERPVNIVVPYAAGGAADVTIRVIAENISSQLGQPVLVINRPGSVAASTSVAKAAPDGYTFMAAAMSHSMNTAMYKKLPYDTLNDFVPVATFGYFNFVIVVNTSLDVKDLKGLIAAIKANPGKYAFGSGGAGSPTHMVAELFKTVTKTDALHVPYRADQNGLADLIAGRIQFMIPSTVAASGHVQAGSIRALATPASRRSPVLPDVPTTAEAGLPEFRASSYYILIAPNGVSRKIVQSVQEVVSRSLQDTAVLRRLTDLDFAVERNSTPASTAALIRKEIERWTPIIESAGVSLQ